MSSEKDSKAGKPARDFRPKDKKDKKPASGSFNKDSKKAKSSSSQNRKGDQEKAAAKVLQEAKAASFKSHSGSSFKKGKEQTKAPFVRKGKSPAEAARPTASILNAPTEIDFPRGGGTSLKPIEYRQTLREARAEASAGNDAPDADLFHDGGKQAKKGKGRASGPADEDRSRKRRKGDDSLAVPGSSLLKDQGIRVEHLNYKVRDPIEASESVLHAQSRISLPSTAACTRI
jgi:rRNA biogenesis protein RRP5